MLNSIQIAAFNSNAKENNALLSGTSITMVIQLNLDIFIADFFFFFAPNLRQHQPPSGSIRAADINGVARSNRGRTPPVISWRSADLSGLSVASQCDLTGGSCIIIIGP